MLRIIKKIMKLAGKNKSTIKYSVITAFLHSIFISFPYMGIYLFFKDLVNKQLSVETLWMFTGIFAVGLLGGVITKTITMLMQQCAGNDVAASKRIYLGDHLKSVPMECSIEFDFAYRYGSCYSTSTNTYIA